MSLIPFKKLPSPFFAGIFYVGSDFLNLRRYFVKIAIALIFGFNFIDGALAQSCPSVSTDTTITSSCTTGIAWTGGGLDIGSITSSTVSVTNPGNWNNAIAGNGILGTLTNYGTISGDQLGVGIRNDGTITSLANNTGGTISADVYGSAIYNGATGIINSLSNSGAITAFGYGVYNEGSITSLTNNVGATIFGSGSGVFNNGGTINALTNSGMISFGDGGSGITNTGTIISLTNNAGATISSDDGGYGIYNGTTGVINSLSNSGTITSINNEGTISSGDFGTLISNGGTGTITSLTNSGTISVGVYGLAIYNDGSITSLTNSGTISAGQFGIPIVNNGTITSLTNNTGATISSGENANAITNTGTITSLTNNTGATISSGVNVISNRVSGTITTLTNLGTISGNINDIQNGGTITTLNNAQGRATTALTYAGILPTNYNIIINNPHYYGQLRFDELPRGQMAFNIYGNTGTTLVSGVAASTVAVGTYADVLQGFLSLSGITGTSGSYGGLSYSLIADTAHSGMWNLVFGSASTSVQSGGTYQSSDLGSTVNPRIDGGTLQVSSSNSVISSAFTITSNNGKIDQNGFNSNFTGNITDDSVGVHGKLTIANTGGAGQGSVTLSGTNTYSGGTEVQSGGNLSITSSDAIGTGPLALVGSATVPATLTTTASMTISNPISVANDPVFSVAPGTTTTISSPIADGGSPGDVVISGGGTLALTAANTYTGATAISSGSTLALSGAGSIATSSGVTNNGNFDVTGKTNNVSVAAYTQSSSGSLAMNFMPTNNQQLNVAGGASLAGALSLNASAGTYSSGKYTLLTANGVTGTFGSFTSNLSSYTRLGYTLGYDANDVYLIFTPNVADTQQSLVNTSSALQSTFTLQNSVLANSFSYDCNEFGANGICISAGGRNTALSAANGLNNTSGLLIAAYRPHPNYRIGAYADQNLSVNNAGSTVNLGNNTPLIGLFGAWNERVDGAGAEVKVSAAYGQKSATVTRQVVGTSEAGSGSSQLNSQGAQATVKYGFAVLPEVIVSPYAGIRYTQNNMGGYTEGASATVTAPLTYSALNTKATTALAGVGASYKGIPQTTLFASAGVESDTNTNNGTYSATTGITGLTPINFNANPVKTRPTAMLGAYYDVEKNQRVGVTGIYRQEPFQAVSTTTVMATYMVGL